MHVPTHRVRRGSRRAARCGRRRTEHPGDQEANASRAHVTPGKTSNKGFLGCFVSVWGFFGVFFFSHWFSIRYGRSPSWGWGRGRGGAHGSARRPVQEAGNRFVWFVIVTGRQKRFHQSSNGHLKYVVGGWCRCWNAAYDLVWCTALQIYQFVIKMCFYIPADRRIEMDGLYFQAAPV